MIDAKPDNTDENTRNGCIPRLPSMASAAKAAELMPEIKGHIIYSSNSISFSLPQSGQYPNTPLAGLELTVISSHSLPFISMPQDEQ